MSEHRYRWGEGVKRLTGLVCEVDERSDNVGHFGGKALDEEARENWKATSVEGPVRETNTYLYRDRWLVVYSYRLRVRNRRARHTR